MRVTVAKNELKRVLKRAAAVADKKSTNQAVSCVLLRADGDRLDVAATDMFISYSTSIEATIGEGGSFAVTAKDLFDRISLMPDGPIDLQVVNASLSVKAKGTARRYTLRGMPGEDFPMIARPDDDAPCIYIPASTLVKLIEMTSFAISGDETRPNINSALLELEGGIARMVTTDAHRLSKCEIKVDGHASASMLIPQKAIAELQKVFSDSSLAMVDVVTETSRAFFDVNGELLSVKLTEGTFPPWRNIIPNVATNVIRVNRSAMEDGVKAVSLSAGIAGLVRIEVANGFLQIIGKSPESGEANDEVPCDVVSGKDGAFVGVCEKYLREPLSKLSSDEIDIGIGGELDPVVMTPHGVDAYEFLGVLMPMRL